jgi:hypothetical protein
MLPMGDNRTVLSEGKDKRVDPHQDRPYMLAEFSGEAVLDKEIIFS